MTTHIVLRLTAELPFNFDSMEIMGLIASHLREAESNITAEIARSIDGNEAAKKALETTKVELTQFTADIQQSEDVHVRVESTETGQPATVAAQTTPTTPRAPRKPRTPRVPASAATPTNDPPTAAEIAEKEALMNANAQVPVARTDAEALKAATAAPAPIEPAPPASSMATAEGAREAQASRLDAMAGKDEGGLIPPPPDAQIDRSPNPAWLNPATADPGAIPAFLRRNPDNTPVQAPQAPPAA